MKVRTLITTAFTAWSATVTTLSHSNNITAQPSKGNFSRPQYVPVHELLTNTTAYNQAIIDCAQELSKATNETRSKLDVDEKHGGRETCEIIFGTMFPELEHATGVHPRALNHKQQAFGDAYSECMRFRLGATRSLCTEKAKKVVMNAEKASNMNHVSKHPKRDPARKDDYDSIKEEREKEFKWQKQWLNKKFLHGIEACDQELSRNSTMGMKDNPNVFGSCIKNVTENYSIGMVSIEVSRDKAKDGLRIPGPFPGGDMFNNVRDSDQREDAEKLSEDLTNCRLQLLSNTTVLTEHGLNYSTRSFKRCVEHAADAYAARLDSNYNPLGGNHLHSRNSNDTEAFFPLHESLAVYKAFVDEQFSNAIKRCISEVAHVSTLRAQDKESFDFCMENVAGAYEKDLRKALEAATATKDPSNLYPSYHNAFGREKAYQQLEKALAQCHLVFISDAVALPGSLLKHSIHPYEACADHAAEKYFKLISNIEKLEQHNAGSATALAASVIPNNSTSAPSSLTKRASLVSTLHGMAAEREQKRIDKLKKQNSAKNFNTGLSTCSNALSHNSTNTTISIKETFQTCIADVTNHYSDDLAAIEEFKTSWDPVLPEEQRSSKRKHLAREHEYRQLRANFGFCRLNFQHMSNRSVIIHHRVNNATLREFQHCISGMATKYTGNLKNINRFMGSDYKQSVSKAVASIDKVSHEGTSISLKKTSIAARDLPPKSITGPDLQSHVLYDVKHGDQFWEAAERLRGAKARCGANVWCRKVSCGLDEACYTDAIHEFIVAIKKFPLEQAPVKGTAVVKRNVEEILSETIPVENIGGYGKRSMVEQWRGLMPNV